MNKEGKNKSFTDLVAWQVGHKLVVETYRLTDVFPNKEIFGLVSQMRRCSISITSNIAEGFSRRTEKDKINFYHTALGSLTELQNQLPIARDVGYLNNDALNNIAPQIIQLQKLIHGLRKVKYTKY